jgi:DHA3 family tetracycline resistance protein-like MFS transporter
VFAGVRGRTDPYRLYIGVEVAQSFLVATAYTTAIVYRVRSGHLNALDLILLGTVLEVSYFVVQLPTGVLADAVSRRMCVIAGLFVTAAAFVMQGLSAGFAVQVIAQIPVGVGAALGMGAQEAWLADESGSTELTSVFLRATQLGLVAGLIGSVLSGVLPMGGLDVAFLVSGGLMVLLGLVLTCVMPETRFRPDRAPRVAGVARETWAEFAGQVGKTRRAMVAVPGLVLLMGMVLFVGMWSEGFDRLWGAYLLRDIRFPHTGISITLWFSAFAVVSALLALGSTHWANKRTERLGPTSVVSTLVALTVATGLAVTIMASSSVFAVAVVAYLAVATMRPVFSPLITGWVVARVDPGVRATALSATDMFDSGGQIAGGPVIGAIGVLASIRVALLASAVALAPAVAFLVAATRRLRAQAGVVPDEAAGEAAGELSPP